MSDEQKILPVRVDVDIWPRAGRLPVVKAIADFVLLSVNDGMVDLDLYFESFDHLEAFIDGAREQFEEQKRARDEAAVSATCSPD